MDDRPWDSGHLLEVEIGAVEGVVIVDVRVLEAAGRTGVERPGVEALQGDADIRQLIAERGERLAEREEVAFRDPARRRRRRRRVDRGGAENLGLRIGGRRGCADLLCECRDR